MVKKIEHLEQKLHEDLEKTENRAVVQSLDEIKKNAMTIKDEMEKHLQIDEEQLQVLKESRDINKMTLNLQKYGIRTE